MVPKNPRGRPATGAERRSVSLPAEVWAQIEAAADGRPLSVELGRLVEEGFIYRHLNKNYENAPAVALAAIQAQKEGQS